MFKKRIHMWGDFPTHVLAALETLRQVKLLTCLKIGQKLFIYEAEVGDMVREQEFLILQGLKSRSGLACNNILSMQCSDAL